MFRKESAFHRLLALIMSLMLVCNCTGIGSFAFAEENNDQPAIVEETPAVVSDADVSASSPEETEEPVVTEAPAEPEPVDEATEAPTEPEVTEEPEVTVEPEVTEEPEVTVEPEVTEEPEVTAEPEVTEEPEVTVEPEVTEEPEVTAEPEVTEEPEVTAEPEVTEEPEVTPEPEVTEAPEVTPEPEVTEEPEVTPEPEVTEEPEVTVEPEVTEEPEVTVEPEVTEESEATEEPEKILSVQEDESFSAGFALVSAGNTLVKTVDGEEYAKAHKNFIVYVTNVNRGAHKATVSFVCAGETVTAVIKSDDLLPLTEEELQAWLAKVNNSTPLLNNDRSKPLAVLPESWLIVVEEEVAEVEEPVEEIPEDAEEEIVEEIPSDVEEEVTVEPEVTEEVPVEDEGLSEEELVEEELEEIEEEPVEPIILTHVDHATGVSVTYSSAAIPEGIDPEQVLVKVAPVTVSNEILLSLCQEGEIITDFIAYDISLIDGATGIEFEPVCNINVTMPAINSDDGSNSLYHVSDNNEVEQINDFEIVGDILSFDSDSFSTYIQLAKTLALEEELDLPPAGDGQLNIGNAFKNAPLFIAIDPATDKPAAQTYINTLSASSLDLDALGRTILTTQMDSKHPYTLYQYYKYGFEEYGIKPTPGAIIWSSAIKTMGHPYHGYISYVFSFPGNVSITETPSVSVTGAGTFSTKLETTARTTRSYIQDDGWNCAYVTTDKNIPSANFRFSLNGGTLETLVSQMNNEQTAEVTVTYSLAVKNTNTLSDLQSLRITGSGAPSLYIGTGRYLADSINSAFSVPPASYPIVSGISNPIIYDHITTEGSPTPGSGVQFPYKAPGIENLKWNDPVDQPTDNMRALSPTSIWDEENHGFWKLTGWTPCQAANNTIAANKSTVLFHGIWEFSESPARLMNRQEMIDYSSSEHHADMLATDIGVLNLAIKQPCVQGDTVAGAMGHWTFDKWMMKDNTGALVEVDETYQGDEIIAAWTFAENTLTVAYGVQVINENNELIDVSSFDPEADQQLKDRLTALTQVKVTDYGKLEADAEVWALDTIASGNLPASDAVFPVVPSDFDSSAVCTAMGLYVFNNLDQWTVQVTDEDPDDTVTSKTLSTLVTFTEWPDVEAKLGADLLINADRFRYDTEHDAIVSQSFSDKKVDLKLTVDLANAAIAFFSDTALAKYDPADQYTLTVSVDLLSSKDAALPTDISKYSVSGMDGLSIKSLIAPDSRNRAITLEGTWSYEVISNLMKAQVDPGVQNRSLTTLTIQDVTVSLPNVSAVSEAHKVAVTGMNVGLKNNGTSGSKAWSCEQIPEGLDYALRADVPSTGDQPDTKKIQVTWNHTAEVVTLKGDVQVKNVGSSYSTEHDELFVTTDGDVLTYAAVMDVRPIQQQIKDVLGNENFWDNRVNDGTTDRIYLTELASSFTMVASAEKGLTFPSDKSKYKLIGAPNFMVSDVTVTDGTVLIIMDYIGDIAPDSFTHGSTKIKESFKTLFDHVVEKTSPVLALEISDVKVDAQDFFMQNGPDATCLLTVKGDVSGSFTSLATMLAKDSEITHVENDTTKAYDFVWNSVQITDLDAGKSALSGIKGGNGLDYIISNRLGQGASGKNTDIWLTVTVLPAEVSVTKTWDDDNNSGANRPASVNAQLLADGQPAKYLDGTEVPALVLSERNNWTVDVKNLPMHKATENGLKAIAYTVVENDVAGYRVTYAAPVVSDNKTTLSITNTELDRISVTATKTWADSENISGFRPASVTVNLLANGTKLDSHVLNADNKWTYTFTGLHAYLDGKPVTYTVSENPVTPYTASYSAPVTDAKGNVSVTVTNTYVPEKISVSASKVWDDLENIAGFRPASVTVNLMADGKKVDSHVLNADNKWAWTFTDLLKYVNGKAVVYTVTEDAVEPYATNYAKPETDAEGNVSITVTNTYIPGTVSVTARKVWNDADNISGFRPANVTVNLLADGKKLDSHVLSADNNWSYAFTGLQQYAEGKAVTYTITEDRVDPYTTVVSEPVTDASGNFTFTVTNTYVPEEISLTAAKIWQDHDNAAGFRPVSVTVNLLANGEKADSHVLDAKNNWSWTFVDLLKYVDGKEVVYTIVEDAVEPYIATYSEPETDEKGNITIAVTNTYTPGEISVTARKTWADGNNADGYRANAVRVRLRADGQEVENRILNAANKWSYTWSGLQQYVDGKAVAYTVTEDPVAHYTTSYAAPVLDAAGNITLGITNTHVPEKTSVTVTKVWDDNEDELKLRPNSITVRLYADGREVTSHALHAGNDWRWTFNGLNRYHNGAEILYTVSEDPVAGYVSTVDGYTVTNTLEPVPAAEIYTVTVRYWYNAIGTETAAPTFFKTYELGDPYHVVSPRIPGWNADVELVSGIVDGNLEFDVIYTPHKVNLTIDYIYNTGKTAAPTYTDVLSVGDTYEVVSPVIPGYKTKTLVCEGTMPDRDVYLVVIYIPETREIVIEDDETPMGIDGIELNVGDCFE